MIKTIFSAGLPVDEKLHIQKNEIRGKAHGKRLCIVTGTHGDELEGQYVCYLLTDFLQRNTHKICGQVDVYPALNPLGIESYHFAGEFVPHVRVIKTAVDISAGAKVFGFPYVYLKTPEPFDTVMLNYNWQIWNTASYSIYAGTTDIIDKNSAKQTWLSIIRFLSENGLVKRDVFPGYKSQVLEDKDFTTITAPCAGIFYKLKSAGSEVRRAETIAKILDPYDGKVLDEIIAPKDGVIFFAHSKALIMEKTAAFQVV